MLKELEKGLARPAPVALLVAHLAGRHRAVGATVPSCDNRSGLQL
jgi:hypothetical protein